MSRGIEGEMSGNVDEENPDTEDRELENVGWIHALLSKAWELYISICSSMDLNQQNRPLHTEPDYHFTMRCVTGTAVPTHFEMSREGGHHVHPIFLRSQYFSISSGWFSYLTTPLSPLHSTQQMDEFFFVCFQHVSGWYADFNGKTITLMVHRLHSTFYIIVYAVCA
ncbi:hypothetical protein P154DRAFT_95686 [Amniculicola lignicola CBS 123094]|uniref:Uncharacterized protein n=1 Tax=Amniculicola lignicola CBS 123094 TaxID=1392246 RepID=A0A6A5WNN5_9PLEO|nr:hypothetical protein P154DRAFT_95686 [Amniculicola lignicola CBS 123094]